MPSTSFMPALGRVAYCFTAGNTPLDVTEPLAFASGLGQQDIARALFRTVLLEVVDQQAEPPVTRIDDGKPPGGVAGGVDGFVPGHGEIDGVAISLAGNRRRHVTCAIGSAVAIGLRIVSDVDVDIDADHQNNAAARPDGEPIGCRHTDSGAVDGPRLGIVDNDPRPAPVTLEQADVIGFARARRGWRERPDRGRQGNSKQLVVVDLHD
jgi:hypothetical protein